MSYKMNKKSYKGLGLMSGSSLDGLDICYVQFTGDMSKDNVSYRILKARTINYPEIMIIKLKEAPSMSGLDLIKLHVEYGHYLGRMVHEFISSENVSVHYVASHGHTIYHLPDQQITFQVGDGETIAAHLSCPLVCNFRVKDVALGGQGAPLVSVGERILFQGVDICLNLGGVADISFKGHNAYDVCPCNTTLNWLASKFDSSLILDKDGKIARSGTIVFSMLDNLENLLYYTRPPPKTICTDKITEEVRDILDTEKHDVADVMRTFVEHIAIRVTDACVSGNHLPSVGHRPVSRTVMVTGGGAFNVFFVEILRDKLRVHDIEMYKLHNDTIKYKESVIFAFLGLRTLLGLQNVSGDATGSAMDSVSGSIHLPPGHSPLSPRRDRFKFHFDRMDSTVGVAD